MGFAHRKWEDYEVVGWARAYLKDSKATLFTLESELNVSHSTLWWCFVHRLPYIDEATAKATNNKLCSKRRYGH